MRYILLFIHALAVTIYQFFFVDPVTIKSNLPESAKPGTQFVAEFTISKGALAGFAKFQMELPEGLTAEESDSKGGSFSLAGQTAKIIWTSVPSSSDITIKVLIKVNATASGDKTLQGKYSYIENNVKQQVEFTPVIVKIDSEAAETPVVATATTAAETPLKPENTSPSVSVARTITAGKTAGSFVVELKIKKDVAKGFAKLQEKISDGYTAVGENADGSSFTFSSSDHVAKFIWTSLPSQEELTVSYKVIPKAGEPKETPARVEGEFNYLDNQDTKKFLIAKEELPGTTSEPVATNTEPTPTTTVSGTVEPEKTEPVKTEPVVETKTEPVVETKTEPVVENKTEASEPLKAVNAPKNSNIM